MASSTVPYGPRGLLPKSGSFQIFSLSEIIGHKKEGGNKYLLIFILPQAYLSSKEVGINAVKKISKHKSWHPASLDDDDIASKAMIPYK